MQVEAILARVLGYYRVRQGVSNRTLNSNREYPGTHHLFPPLLLQPLHFKRGMTRIKTSLN